ncbi:phosphatase PAP2 family protein [Parablastomonas sp. CN1-191]|uniref:phosphatase PAP2 family protein n=1 Tax=Parablastomonas sp. CN1-191 TaxID=3400908 RepID=UPI003BF8BE35
MLHPLPDLVAPAPALIFAAVCFALFLVLDRLVAHDQTRQFDRRWLTAPRYPSGKPRLGIGWAPVMRGLTQLGGPVVRYAIAAPLALWLWHLGYPDSALWLVAALASGWIVDGVIKKTFKRKRPTLVPRLARAGGPSFPSGHTLNASLVYCGLALAFAPVLGPTGLTAALIAALTLSLMVAFSRVWLGVHWPTDVTAGWLVGTGWWCLALAIGQCWLGH